MEWSSTLEMPDTMMVMVMLPLAAWVLCRRTPLLISSSNKVLVSRRFRRQMTSTSGTSRSPPFARGTRAWKTCAGRRPVAAHNCGLGTGGGSGHRRGG